MDTCILVPVCGPYLKWGTGFRFMVKELEQELCLCDWNNLVDVLELRRWHFLWLRYSVE